MKCGILGNAPVNTPDKTYMNKTRTGSFAAALALTAATVAFAPAHAAPAATVDSAIVHYDTTGAESSASGSLENEAVQVGLVLIAGIGVSIALAVGAGIGGGAIELPPFPGLPV